ncbi:hypothetical protein [Thalassomonas sp. RHCl1]|uniref:hypothetical protein n=1 Tax=Thalassomonas sp. RHCl1 TaxID=2995320 RepID=UPI00248B9F34|nr:hypothetical protein [Thalassomonas sp. RHCl1]
MREEEQLELNFENQIVSPVTVPKKISRNAKYEQEMRRNNFSKITIWVPNHCQDDFKLMATLCREDKDLVPCTMRSIKTGRMKGINQ